MWIFLMTAYQNNQKKRSSVFFKSVFLSRIIMMIEGSTVGFWSVQKGWVGFWKDISDLKIHVFLFVLSTVQTIMTGTDNKKYYGTLKGIHPLLKGQIPQKSWKKFSNKIVEFSPSLVNEFHSWHKKAEWMTIFFFVQKPGLLFICFSLKIKI